MARRAAAPADRRAVPAKIGLALAGGGFLGAAYELGALAALAESIDGLALNQLDAYVGVSAGSFIAAGLANGLSPYQMVRMFVDSADSATSFDPSALVQPAYRELAAALKALPKVGAAAVRAGLRNWPLGMRPMLWRAIEQASPALPTGMINAALAQQKLAAILNRPGRSDDFRKLRPRLRVLATDIDTGLPVEFGAPGFDRVPISLAVAASSAIPGLFAPVEVDGRFYVDGALNKTLHASVALDAGARLVLCVNPLVPFSGSFGGTAHSAKSPGGQGSGSRVTSPPHRNLGSVLAQSVRTAIRSRMSVGLAKYGATHPGADVLLFEPRSDDARMFHSSILSVSKRRQLCEHAYQQTRRDLRRRAVELEPILARHGLSLNRAVLDDSHLHLLRGEIRSAHAKPHSLLATTARLRHTLDDLDRVLRLSNLDATN